LTFGETVDRPLAEKCIHTRLLVEGEQVAGSAAAIDGHCCGPASAIIRGQQCLLCPRIESAGKVRSASGEVRSEE
jgi:hypothetical protein